MRIRKFKKADAIKVSNLIRRCLREVVSKDYPQKTIENLCSFFTPALLIKNLKDREIFVAVEKDKILGTASLKGNTVFTVFINPDFHGKGIGSKLMNQVEILAKDKGYKVINVPSGITSLKFYEKRGYQKVRIVRSKDHGETIEMSKKL